MTQPVVSNIKRQGRSEAVRKSMRDVAKRDIKTADERTSSEKLVGGPMRAMMWSWAREKSSMVFWRSRRLRKKSYGWMGLVLTNFGGKSG